MQKLTTMSSHNAAIFFIINLQYLFFHCVKIRELKPSPKTKINKIPSNLVWWLNHQAINQEIVSSSRALDIKKHLDTEVDGIQINNWFAQH